jgi:peptidoglycan/LPS O-acetylase OafA/YrhL
MEERLPKGKKLAGAMASVPSTAPYGTAYLVQQPPKNRIQSSLYLTDPYTMKLNSIQFLRAIAALLVVYDHSLTLQNSYGTSWQQKFFNLSRFGCIGVDLFFVISGFIILFVANNYQGKSQGLYFLEKRFYRINPIYYILTIIAFVINLTQNSQPVSNSLKTLFDSLLILPIRGDINDHNLIVFPGWTLVFEWLFYLLFYLIILLKVSNKFFSLTGMILLLVICGRIFKPMDLRLSLITNPILLEFLLGCLICYIYLTVRKIHPFIGVSCLLMGVCCYVYMIIYGFDDIWYNKNIESGTLSVARFLQWGLPSSLIVAGCIFLEKNGWFARIWNNKYALLCGDASYSIYLMHFIAFKLLRLLYKETGYFLPTDVMVWLQFFIAVAISIWFYKVVEKPLLQYMYKNWMGNTPLISKKVLLN